MIVMLIGDPTALTRDEELACRELARRRNAANDAAGKRSEATRYTKQSAMQTHEVGAAGETGFQAMTGCQMDVSTFPRAARDDASSLSDFRLHGIGKVEVKSTTATELPLRVPLHSISKTDPPAAFALMECHYHIPSVLPRREDYREFAQIHRFSWNVWFRGIILAKEFYAKAIVREAESMSGRVWEHYHCERKHLQNLWRDAQGRWRVFVTMEDL